MSAELPILKDRITGEVGGAVEIQCNLAVPVLHGHILEFSLGAAGYLQCASGVVDENVDAAESLDEIFHRGLAPVVVSDISEVNLRLGTVCLALPGNFLGPLGTLVAADADVGLLVTRESNRAAGTYAVRRSCDENVSCFRMLEI